MSLPSDAERLALMAAVAEVADGTQLLGETVQRLLDVIVPAFADVATLDVGSASGEIRRLGARVERPHSDELAQALLARHQSGDPGVGVLRTITTGESQLVSPVTDEGLRAIATNEADLAMLRSLTLRQSIYVPLTARGRTLGALACSTRTPQRTFTAEDLTFAETLGSRIALALDNAGLSATVSGLEKRLEATLANLAAGVIVRDPAGATVFANQAGAELLGVGSVEELFNYDAEQLTALFDAYTERGLPLALDDLPTMRALREQVSSSMVIRSVRRSTRRERWLLHKATPVFEADGSLMVVVSVIEDITEAKRAEFAQRLLADVSRELASSLDYQQTLQRVAELAVPGLADWCGVSIRGSGPVLEPVAIAHTDPNKLALVRDWAQRFPTRIDGPTGAAEVLRSGRPALVREVTPAMLEARGATEAQRHLVAEVGLRSMITVPLAVPGRPPFGTLSLVMAESRRAFDRDDLRVAEELGRRAATAVENARLFTERTRVAEALQHGLLPPTLPEVRGYRLASLYRPAGELNEVGGDFYDAYHTPAGWMVVVGDVTGHGAEAAALTSLSRFTLRTAARLLGDPLAAMEQLNEALLEQPQLSLVSLCCALLPDPLPSGAATAHLLLAGHPPPYHVHAGRAGAVGEPGQILGFDRARRWTTCSVRLDPGDLLVLYTDGVTDAGSRGERFGEIRLAETLGEARDPGDAVARIDQAIAAFAPGPHRDDTAVIAVQRAPVAIEAGPPTAGPGPPVVSSPP